MSSTTPIVQLRDIMARLRDPQTGCAWDIKQDFQSIAAFTLEEAYEVVDAIEREDTEDLKDELGDLLLQVVFHAQMASEQGLFTFDDVAQAICDKMLRRHPHVFGNATFTTEAELKASWEAIKAQERREKLARKASAADGEVDGDAHALKSGANEKSNNAPETRQEQQSKIWPEFQPDIKAATRPEPETSAVDGIATNLPALKRADKIQQRAARVGFDWPNVDPVWDKLNEEILEVKAALESEDADAVEDEIGDLLFTVVNLARHCKVDSEAALRRASAKFEYRFRRVEHDANEAGTSLETMELNELDALWGRAKRGS